MVLSETVQQLKQRVRGRSLAPFIDKPLAVPEKRKGRLELEEMRRQLREGSTKYTLTEDEENRLSRVFDAMDIRKDGKIEPDELKMSFMGMGMDIRLSECEELLWETQDYATFDLTAMRSMYARGLSFPQEPRRLFNFVLFMMLDVNNNGTVSPDDVFDYFFPKVDRATLDMYMTRLFPRDVDPSGRVTASAFVRTLQSQLWTGTVHKVSDQRHTRPAILLPPRFKDAKDKRQIVGAAGRDMRTATAGRGRRGTSRSGLGLEDSIKKEGILEVLSAFKSQYKKAEAGLGVSLGGLASQSETLTELRLLQEYAETHSLNFGAVEKIMHMFKTYDSDHSGFIDKKEFSKLLQNILKVDQVDEGDLDRAWREHGTTDFMSLDDFFAWYKEYVAKQRNTVAIGRGASRGVA